MMRELMLCVFILIYYPYVLCENSVEHATDVSIPELESDISIPKLESDVSIPELESDVSIPELESDVSKPERAMDDFIEEHETDVPTHGTRQTHTFMDKLLNGEENYETSAPMYPLCIHESNITGRVTPCNEDNTFPACFYTSIDKIFECRNQTLWKVIPLCVLPATHQHLVVGCDNSSPNLCPLVNSNPLFLELCKRSIIETCLGKGNIFQPCYNVRVKRFEPQVPQLDVDGYYASCENCSLNVRMLLDEETNEQPIIEIRSEPLKEEEEEEDQEIQE